MRHLHTTTSILYLFSGTQVFAQSKDPLCIRTCADQYPTSSWCNGDETGTALSTCLCNTLLGSQLLQCWTDQCSDADKATYLVNAKVPEPCRNQLFPGVSVEDVPASSAIASRDTSTSTTGGSPTDIPDFTVVSPDATVTRTASSGSPNPTTTLRAGGEDPATDSAMMHGASKWAGLGLLFVAAQAMY
jgi:hypothetical protein